MMNHRGNAEHTVRSATRALDRARATVATALLATTLTLFPLLNGCTVETTHPGEVWIVSLLHSASDEAEEPAHLADVDRLLLPEAIARGATVVVVTVGSAGRTAPHVLSTIDFDTSAIDGANPVLRERLQRTRKQQLTDEVTRRLAAIPYSTQTDVFGGVAAAEDFFAQFPSDAPKTLVSVGDQLATTPGCELEVQDMSTPQARQALIAACAPDTHDLSGVDVMLIGAGFSLDQPIDSRIASGLEPLLREYYGSIGARVVAYSPVVVVPPTQR